MQTSFVDTEDIEVDDPACEWSRHKWASWLWRMEWTRRITAPTPIMFTKNALAQDYIYYTRGTQETSEISLIPYRFHLILPSAFTVTSDSILLQAQRIRTRYFLSISCPLPFHSRHRILVSDLPRLHALFYTSRFMTPFPILFTLYWLYFS